MLRPAPNFTRQSATVQWRPDGGTYRDVARLTTTDPVGSSTPRISCRTGVGAVRVLWHGPLGVVVSRAVGVRVG